MQNQTVVAKKFYLSKNKMSILKPNEYLESVSQIDLKKLYQSNIKCLLLDMDNTLRPRDTGVVPNEVLEWINKAKLMGFRLCIVSNNWHIDVIDDASTLGLLAVNKALKPLPFAYMSALKKCDCKRSEAVVIGDQLLTDILGASLYGLKSILVIPQCKKDIQITSLVRKLENKLVSHYFPKGPSNE